MEIKPLPLQSLKVACSNCNLFQLCLPMGIEDADLDRLESIIRRRKPIQRGELVYRVGDHLQSIYAIRSGSVKTYTFTEDGFEQVTGFHLSGELLGLDAISDDKHACTAKALETTYVCEIPFERFEELWQQVPSLPRQMVKLMSKELLHDQSLLMQLSKKSAEERLAAFLLNLSMRFKQRGFSAKEFNLSMSRTDIGNYLGLAVETVSRLFSRFQEDQLLTVNRKHILLQDLDKLATMAGSHSGESCRQQA